MHRRISAYTLAGVACAALTLTACGSESLDTGSGTSSSTSSSSSEASSSTGEAMGDETLAEALPESVASAGKIIVGMDASYAPNEFLGSDGKTIEGMNVDIFNAVAAKFGVEAEYQNATFDTIILGVNAGKYDIGVSSFTINDERKQQVNMVSYFNAGTQWATREGNPDDVDPDNACGLSVAVQSGTVQVDDVTARSEACEAAGDEAIDIQQFESQADATAAIASGRVAAGLADSPVMAYAVQQTDGRLELLGDIYDSAPYGIVVQKAQTQFAEAIARAVQALIDEGVYEEALSNWGVEDGAIDDPAVNPAP